VTRAVRALVLASLTCALACTGCAGWQATAKTIDQAAVILCDLFYSQQKPALNIDDIEKAFCSTAEQVAPFLAEAKRAEMRGGAVRESERAKP